MSHAMAVPDDPAFTPLLTERLLLRPPEVSDADQLHRLVNDWTVVRNLSRLPFPYPRALTSDWIAGAARQRAEGTGIHLVITGRDDGRELVVGCVGLRLDRRPRTGSLGYWVARGAGTALDGSALLTTTGTTLGLAAVAVLALVVGALAPWTVAGWRARSRQRAVRGLWPEVVDHLVAAVRAGVPLPDALAALA